MPSGTLPPDALGRIAGVPLAPVLVLRRGYLAGAGAAARIGVLFLAAGSTLLAFAAWYWSPLHGGIARMGARHELQASSRSISRRPCWSSQ
jgi:hypothetical protein